MVPRDLRASFKVFPLLNYHLVLHEPASKIWVEEVFVPVVFVVDIFCVVDIGCGRRGDSVLQFAFLTNRLPRPGDVWGYPHSPKSWHHLHSTASFRLPSHTVLGTLHFRDTLVQLIAQKLLWCLLQCSWSRHIIRNSHTSTPLVSGQVFMLQISTAKSRNFSCPSSSWPLK